MKRFVKMCKTMYLVNTNLCLFFSDFVWKGQIAWWEEICFWMSTVGFKCDGNLKGIVHLNIIFSYMKVNKICNLDQPVY